jgi:hypothetical protein
MANQMTFSNGTALARGWRLGVATVIATVCAALGAEGARASLFFLFNPTNASPGDKVVVRTGGTPADFKLSDRVKGRMQPIRVYLVPNTVAGDVSSRDDPRLRPIGTLVPDKNGHGVLTFRVPAVKGGGYAAAAWCPGCAAYSLGQTFSTFQVTGGIVPRFRPLMLLRVEAGGSSSNWPLAAGSAAAVVAVLGAIAVFLRRSWVQGSTTSASWGFRSSCALLIRRRHRIGTHPH